MKGLLAKDLLTIKNKYGIKRIIMDICIMATLMIFLKGTGAIYISFLLIPIEIMNITVRQSRQSGVARATCPD